MRTAFARVSIVLLTVYLLALAGQGQASSQAIQDPAPKHVRLRGHVATYATAAARLLGRLPSNTNIPLIFVLPLHHKEELQVLLTRLYDPADPLYGQYLSPEEFAVRFGPTQADYDAVADYARTMGLTVTGTHQNRTLLNVSGSTSGIESAFSLRLQHYEAANGRRFYAADNDPEVPDVIASRIVGILGLDNAAVWHSHNSLVPATQASPHQIGTGPGGGLTPSDIRKAYNIAGVTFNGAGQTLGLFELDGYTPTDVAAYLGYYGLPSVPLQNVIVDGFSGVPGSGAGEVTLDIELQVALAPGASRIIVYEGPNSITGVVDTYNRIATDNLAKQISSSWGLEENLSFSGAILAEDAIFQQMAAQGQSIYAASGDKGAYDNGSTLSVDDPASQPYMVGTGGTKLFVNADGTYNHETAWNTNGTINGGAGGGG
ncbi:MAG TPA: protease pro-enzyme activation domain-containing protein, partial [Acidobacteriota bacterium]|nr:protease pro-enzyme activation domain-containing protein [Acidobacteriota bacterium]